MKLNNKGLSLVELIVVIAIMGVIAGMVTMGLSAAMSKPAEECAEKMATALKNGRLTTMGKQSIQMKFYVDGNGSIWLEETITKADGSVTLSSTKIGEKGVNVEYTLTDGSVYNLGTTPLVLSFNRSSGSFNTCNGTSAYCESIKVTKGSREMTLKLAHLTGKVTIE